MNKTKEDLIEMLNNLPDGAIVKLEEVSYDGTLNSKPIKEIVYDEWNNVYVIK